MRKVFLFVLFFLLVIAPTLPMVMEPTDSYQSTIVPDDVPKELLDDVQAPNTIPEGDVELDMMFFAHVAPNDEGIYYACRRGINAIANFGVSKVHYLAEGVSFTIEFPGANEVVPEGEEPTGSITNYFLGNDPSKWRTGLVDYSVLRYPNIYPGIDLVYRISDGHIKYEFVVQPDMDPKVILLRYSDADDLQVSDDSVSVSKDGRQMEDGGLWAFQKGTSMDDIPCVFRAHDAHTVAFSVGHYDTSCELVIDPVVSLVYSTFLGGTSSDYGYGIAVESGCAYVTGHIVSSDFPTVNAYDSTHNGFADCFVTKFAADGQSLNYSTFLGGTFGDDWGYGITVESGCAFITGRTDSSDFPTVNAYDSTHNGGVDCFVTKFAADGQSLVYSTFLGGTFGDDWGYGIAVEGGCAFITGNTQSSDFPTVNAYDSTHNGEWDCFVTKLAVDGQSLNYSTFLGGVSMEEGFDIGVEDGCAYVAGRTYSSGFPTINAYDSTHNGFADCFVTKFAADGQSLNYSTFLGGVSSEEGFGIAVEDGYVYVRGRTDSSDFPTANAYDSTYNGGGDSFVTKFATDGQSLNYSTFLGGTSDDSGWGIAVESGCAYITGFTQSSGLPTVNAYDSTYNGGVDCFVTKFATDGQSLNYSTFLGGALVDHGWDIAVESGCAYITGYTQSSGLPTTNAYDSVHNGGWDCFVSLLLLSPDSDMDGLTDWDEARYGTDPFCIDTDNDNFLDGYEVTYGSDPLDPMSYPAMPLAWYDAIYEDLDGNTTLIQNLIAWSNGNASLLQTVLQQLDANATLLQQVISWLDGNHTAIETLFTYVEGNATLLLQTVDALDGNATLIQYLITWSDDNATLLQTVMQQLDANATLLQQVISWLDGNHTAIETLFTFVEGNATLLVDTVNAVNANSAQLVLLAAIVTQNTEALSSINATHIGDIDEIRAILDMLGATVGDTDYDGLDDLDEIAIGTNIQCLDTDCDNLNDAFEVKIGTDPLDDDSDGDTYLDGIEVLAGTDPLDANDYPGATTPTTTTTTSSSPPPDEFSPTVLMIVIAGAGIGVTVVIVLVLRKRRGAS